MLYKNQRKGNNSKTVQGKVNVFVHCTELLQETCIPSLESIEFMVTKLHPGQGMLYKNQSKRSY